MTLQTQLHIRLVQVTALLALVLLAGPGFAQPVPQDGDAADPALTRVSPQPPPAAAPGAGTTVAAPAGKAAPGDAALKQRVEQLEEQLVDMQVLVGTLESLARGGTGAAPVPRSDDSSGYGTGGDPRVDGLETQVRALAAQIEQLTAQVQALSAASRRTDAGTTAPTGTAAAPGPGPALADPSRFGSTTVTAGTSDAIGGLIESGPAKPGAPAAQPLAPPSSGALAPPPAGTAAPPTSGTPAPPASSDTVAMAPPAFIPPHTGAQDPSANPKQLYETAYGYLMQRDYGAAQAAFEDFLARYPKDSLAGNAQYWLGEAHFVRGEYKAAAGAFLKGYQNYAGNARAADSLLKLAMSLDRLGQKDAACSSYSELSTRFPDAPENVKTRAKSERQRISCP
jgi:tol-pal system protein YbgF